MHNEIIKGSYHSVNKVGEDADDVNEQPGDD